MLKKYFVVLVLLAFQGQAQDFITGWSVGVNTMAPQIENSNRVKQDFSNQWEKARFGLSVGVFKDFIISDQFDLRTHLGYELRHYN